MDDKPYYLSRSTACGPQDRAPSTTVSYAWWVWKADGLRPAVAGPLSEGRARALLAELNGEEVADG